MGYPPAYKRGSMDTRLSLELCLVVLPQRIRSVHVCLYYSYPRILYILGLGLWHWRLVRQLHRQWKQLLVSFPAQFGRQLGNATVLQRLELERNSVFLPLFLCHGITLELEISCYFAVTFYLSGNRLCCLTKIL